MVTVFTSKVASQVKTLLDALDIRPLRTSSLVWSVIYCICRLDDKFMALEKYKHYVLILIMRSWCLNQVSRILCIVSTWSAAKWSRRQESFIGSIIKNKSFSPDTSNSSGALCRLAVWPTSPLGLMPGSQSLL